MHRVWTVVTHDLAKAGPFIMGSHQALLLVMWWKMGSNAVICFMVLALLCFTDSLLTHKIPHKCPYTCTTAYKDKWIHTHTHTQTLLIHIELMDACASAQVLK